MTSNSSVTSILPRVRKTVLQLQVEGISCFGLSYLVRRVVNKPSQILGGTGGMGRVPLNHSMFTSSVHKRWRGHVQKCLQILAVEGIMLGRNKVELVQYEKVDKFFRVRITKDEAKKRLAKYK